MICQKELFQLPEEVHYLNAAYMSPQLKSVEQAGIQAVSLKNFPGSIAPAHFLDSGQNLRTTLGSFLNLSAHRIALLPSVSYGMAIVAKNLAQKPGLTPGQQILTVENEFPSDIYAWEGVIAQKHLELLTIAAPNTLHNRAELWNKHIIAAITERTAMVVIGHVHWTDGTIFDLGAISVACKKHNAWLVLDTTQSLGALPLDFAKIQPDALICAGYKWLMGPYSLGFGYFSSTFDHGLALEESWVNRIKSDDFKELNNYQSQYREGAYRYNVGQQANFILNPMLQTAVQQLIAWGPENIQAYCKNLVAAPLTELKKLGYWVEDEDFRASHLFGIALPKHVAINDITEKLTKQNIRISLRGSMLRISPHVYNEPANMQALVAALS
jgi:selenocysteine lyase/cysteine desulfurase